MANNIEKQLKEISERLEQGVKEIFTSERYTEYLNTMSKFHNYSFNNTLLITMQKPEATLVAGYQAWQKKFNRHVKRGEKGIQIIAPAPIREKQEIEKTLHSRDMHAHAGHILQYPQFFQPVQRAWAVWALCKMSFASMMDGSFGYDFGGGMPKKTA